MSLLSRILSAIWPEPRYRRQPAPRPHIRGEGPRLPIAPKGGTGAVIVRTPSGDRYGVPMPSKANADRAAQAYVAARPTKRRKTR